MNIICAWCKKDMGEKEPLHNKCTSHGICEPCAADMKKRYKISAALDTGDIASIELFLDGGRK